MQFGSSSLFDWYKIGRFGARLRGWLSPAWPAHAAQVIPSQSQVVQFIMFASLYFVGQAKTSSCLCSITQPGQSTKALANMWANSLQPAKLRPRQPCSRDTTFSVVSPGPGRGALLAAGGQARSRDSVANAASCMPRAQPGCRDALANALLRSMVLNRRYFLHSILYVVLTLLYS
jgi:hypothetical protein